MMFRELSEDEKVSFRAWARENYTPMEPIQGIWHPVVQEECAKINAEHGDNFNPQSLL
jgi:hypothetical protein